MNDQELEKTLLETLRITKENRDYIIKIDRRQRWARNLTTFYWSLIIIAALFGTFYAFPYLKEARERIGIVWGQVSAFANFADSGKGVQ